MLDGFTFGHTHAGLDLAIGTTQIDLEQLYAKNQTFKAIKDDFCERGFDVAFDEIDIPRDFGVDLLVQMELHKQALPETLIGILWKHFKDEDNPFQACADMLYKAAENNVVDYGLFGDRFSVRFEISAEARKRIDTYQYPLPMIEPPTTVWKNTQTGYRTLNGSMILKKNHHEEDICLDHINRVNSIPLKINADILAFVENRWKNIDKRKPNESFEDFKKRRKAFDKFCENSADVIKALMMLNDRFWLTHKYDKRGRTYCQG